MSNMQILIENVVVARTCVWTARILLDFGEEIS